MKHKVGDIVRVKSKAWYDENKDEDGQIDFLDWAFIPEMVEYCGKELTIRNKSDVHYSMTECPNWCWCDDMLE